MALSAGGIGSGLDVNSIVSQLMALERRPLDQLGAQKSDLSAQLSAYGQLKSAFSTFQSAMKGLSSSDKFQVYSATPSNSDSFTATASSTASAAVHSIDVLALANAHKMTSGKDVGSTYADADTAIGTTGTLEITQDAAGTPRTFQIAIDGTNNTLSGIRDAINNAADNTGVSASIVNTGTESKLVLSSTDSGTENTITIDTGTTASVATALGFETIAGNEAADASVKIDGITVTSASNTVTDALSGVSLTLKQAAPGTVETLNVSQDTAKVKESVQKFVDAYNDVRSTIKTLGGEDATLQGESSLLTMQRQMQNILNTSASGLGFNYLSEIGIETDSTTGDLTLDSATLDGVISSNFSDLADLFADSSQGFAVRFEAMADSLIATDGLIDTREDGINSRISYVEDRETNLEYRLEIIEARHRRQFSALDTLISQMNSTSSFLSQQLSALPTPNSIGG